MYEDLENTAQIPPTRGHGSSCNTKAWAETGYDHGLSQTRPGWAKHSRHPCSLTPGSQPGWEGSGRFKSGQQAEELGFGITWAPQRWQMQDPSHAPGSQGQKRPRSRILRSDLLSGTAKTVQWQTLLCALLSQPMVQEGLPGSSFLTRRQSPDLRGHSAFRCLSLYKILQMAFRVTLASLVAQLVKNPPAMRETWVRSLGWEDPLENEKAIHSSILAWRIPRTV